VRNLGLGRYLAEWLGLVVGLAAAGEAVRVGFDFGIHGFRGSVLAGVLVVGLVDLLVYVLVARGLHLDPSRFMAWWGLSVMAKLVLFGVSGWLLVGSGLVERKPFLLSLAVAFPVFSAHQVLRLVARVPKARAQAGE